MLHHSGPGSPSPAATLPLFDHLSNSQTKVCTHSQAHRRAPASLLYWHFCVILFWRIYPSSTLQQSLLNYKDVNLSVRAALLFHPPPLHLILLFQSLSMINFNNSINLCRNQWGGRLDHKRGASPWQQWHFLSGRKVPRYVALQRLLESIMWVLVTEQIPSFLWMDVKLPS